MIKTAAPDGQIVFRCHCQVTVAGGKDDTLMAEGSYDQQENDLKHATFIERAPYDLAGNIVMKSCPQCALDFLTMIRVGANETTMYACGCGWRGTHDEYTRMDAPLVKPPAASTTSSKK